jgi:hypothetical protein
VALTRRLAVLLSTAVAAFAAATAAPAAPAAPVAPTQFSPVVITKTCSRGYTHAVIGGQEKCLRAGEFCAHRYDRQYRRYGYRCVRYDARVGRYRLIRA